MYAAKFMEKTIAILAIVILMPLIAGQGCDKHEHPAEHPAEHPKDAGSGDITKEALGDAIEEYVKENSTDGYFVVTDDKNGEQLKLTLDKVHRKRLSKVGPDRYFACADFKATNGKMYDLDVFMTGKTTADLKYSEFSVHKEDGKERYTWIEDNGVWKKKPIGAVKSEEHPKEHPDGKEHPEGKEHPDEKEHPKEHPAEHPK